MSDTKRFNSVKPKQLASDLTSSSSALKLTEIKDWGGTNDLTAGQFSDYIPATLINDARTRVEFVLLTASTIANYATAGITIYKRGLKYYAEGDSTDIDEVTANKLAWTAGETKVLLGTNPPNLYGQFANKDNDETITGKYTFPEGGSANAPVSGTVYSAPTDDLEYSPKKYIDDIAIAGSPDMTVTVKGIAEEATEAEIDADTGAGATTARLAVNPSTLATSKYGTQLPTADEKAALAGTSGSPSTLNKYITEDDVEEDGFDQTQTTQDADVNCGEADATTKYNAIAQSFVADKTSIAGVKLWKEADDGAFTGTVTVDLLSDGGGDVPVAAPVLATVTLSNVAWLALSDSAEFTATFGSAYSATIGTKYWIKISTSTADNTNFINIGTNSAGGYSTGSVKFYNVTDDWTAIATIDLYFKTITTTNSKIVRADSSGKIDQGFLNTVSFGGDGSDGALDTSGGVVDIDLGGASSVIKNYSSINVAGNNLTFSNPHANGTVVTLKSVGNVVISADIDLAGMGCAGGVAETDGVRSSNWGVYTADGDVTEGGASDGASPGSAGAAGVKMYDVLSLCPGSGGGGGYSVGAYAGGTGGNGGGSLMIECNGSLNFTGTVDCSAEDGAVGIATAAEDGTGGGGGGAGGNVLIKYTTLTAKSGTVNVDGGDGGVGFSWVFTKGSGGGAGSQVEAGTAGGVGGNSGATRVGGDGGSGWSAILPNTI